MKYHSHDDAFSVEAAELALQAGVQNQEGAARVCVSKRYLPPETRASPPFPGGDAVVAGAVIFPPTTSVPSLFAEAGRAPAEGRPQRQ